MFRTLFRPSVVQNVHLRRLANVRQLSITNKLNFQYTEQHEELKKTVQKLVEKEINPYIDQWEKEKGFDSHKLFKKFGDAGLLGITRDPKYGGLGLDYSFTIAFYEELGYRCNAGGPLSGLGVQTDMAVPALYNFGTEELKEQFLKPAILGDYIACVGVSEPSAGSDVAAIKTTAKKDGDDYVINGEKMWITNGIEADWMCALVNTSDDKPHLNKSLIIIPMDAKGVNKATKISKLGHHSSDNAHIFFDNVRVPQKYLIGDEGMGFTYQMLQFQDERLCVAASTVGSLDRLIEETINYCKIRKAFGHPIIDNQVIHFRLAELKSEVELLRSLIYRASDKMVEGEDATYLATIAKLKCGRLGREVVDSCLQYFGGMGYSDEMLITRSFRDMRLLSIAGGTDEIMLGILCKIMDILPRKKSN